jgi:hypothetical protein
VGIGAVGILLALIAMAAALARAAYRLDHDTRDLAESISRVRQVRQALDLLRSDAGTTRGSIEGTGRSMGLADGPATRR